MKKRCIICNREIETKLSVYTKNFIVNYEPCVCSECVTNLYDSLCEKDGELSEYKECVIGILEDVIMNYPEEWNDEIEGYLAAELIKTRGLIGCSTTETQAISIISNIKKQIDDDPEKNLNMRKNIKSKKSKSATQIVNNIVPVETQLVVLQAIGNDDRNDKKQFKEIINEVKGLIRGQDNAVESIGRLIFHNQQCAEYNKSKFIGPKISKQNMILVGPSGTGKTATVTEYCKLLQLPYVIADMTAYTQAGYHGANIEDIFIRLIKEADDNVELAQRGIVIMDEGDKNEARESAGEVDVGGKGVIDSLLKKIEGSDIDLGKGKIFNSTNTTFITMGVYPRLYNIRKERVAGKKSIGFCASKEDVVDYGEFVADDFIKHGFSQEYVGRFSNIVELNALTDEAYLDILRNSKNSAYRQYKALFDYSFGIELIITPEGEMSIIEQAKKYNIGARGLHRSLSKVLENVEKRIILDELNCKKVVIDKGCEVKIL